MNYSQSVEVISCTLQELLDTHNKVSGRSVANLKGELRIPEYQRPYVWGERQVNRLLNDLWEYQQWNEEDKPKFYLGSIILHQNNGSLNIIDGQQRITTILMMGLHKDDDFKAKISYSNSTSIDNIKRIYEYLGKVKSKEVHEFRTKNVIEGINFEDINITLVVTNTEDLAYIFFETQNTGGVRLSGSDIVKAHHLRAIPDVKMVNHQARRWERMDSKRIEDIMQMLAKLRFWNQREWRFFPFYRNTQRIKSEIINEFTERTLDTNEDISYYYSSVKVQDGRRLQTYESEYKQLWQPLWDGNNTMDYVNEYIDLFDLLFTPGRNDHRVPDDFYEFVEALLQGHYGTLFLKELLQMSIVAYVSRFGFHRLTEASLWLYRSVYSKRIDTVRNVREDSAFKLVRDNKLINNILDVYTVDQLIDYLQRYTYRFDTNNMDKDTFAKPRYIQSIRGYFNDNDENFIKDKNVYSANPESFDKDLISAITAKINSLHG